MVNELPNQSITLHGAEPPVFVRQIWIVDRIGQDANESQRRLEAA
jgi:hypothetical protein